MATDGFTPTNTTLERELEGFAEYLCARRGLAECTISDCIGTIRRPAPAIGLNPPHYILDELIVKVRNSGALYSPAVITSLALERYPVETTMGNLHATRTVLQAQIRFFVPSCLQSTASHLALRQSSQNSKREALQIGIPCYVLERLLVGIRCKSYPVGVTQF